MASPELAIKDFGYKAGWRSARHPRLAVDLGGDRRADIVAFGEEGVWVSRAKADGSFAPRKLALTGHFGTSGWAGGWNVMRHLRLVADTTGDKRNDIVGFSDGGMWVARAQADGSFARPQLVLRAFGWNHGWKLGSQPRYVVDTNGDGRNDVIGFGNDGVWVARGKGDGSFAAPQLVTKEFSYNAGWDSDLHPRFVADVTGDRRVDLVGFHDDGVWVSYGQADGGFTDPQKVTTAFSVSTGWRADRHPRLVADLSGDGRPDLVGFGEDGVWVARCQAGGGFAGPERVTKAFSYRAGWSLGRHPRFVADVNGDGRPDLVGIADDGVWVARAKANGSFE